MSGSAQVRGAYNAISVVGDAVGDTLYYGQGAGMMPTASTVTADLIDLAVGRAQRTFHTLRLWSPTSARLKLRPPGTVRSRFYFRLLVEDRPGVLADVCRVLADHEISIASVIQHEAAEAETGLLADAQLGTETKGEKVQLVIMSHTALAGQFRAAAARMERLPSVARPCTYYPVGD